MTASGHPGAVPEQRAPVPNDRGFTLIELLVYMGLMVIVLVLAGGMLINSTSTENGVRKAAQNANSAQVISRSISNGIRNASAFQVSNPSTATQLLVARTADGASDISWSCQAWYFDGNQMYTMRRSPASSIAVPTAETLSTWSTIGDELSPLESGQIFTPSGDSVLLAFRVGTENTDSPVNINTSATRPKIPQVGAPCF